MMYQTSATFARSGQLLGSREQIHGTYYQASHFFGFFSPETAQLNGTKPPAHLLVFSLAGNWYQAN